MAGKKTFKNPATNFISTAEPEDTIKGSEKEATAIPKGYKLVPESKTVRAQILIRPSTKEALKELAEAKGTSLNDLINTAIEEYIERQG